MRGLIARRVGSNLDAGGGEVREPLYVRSRSLSATERVALFVVQGSSRGEIDLRPRCKIGKGEGSVENGDVHRGLTGR